MDAGVLPDSPQHSPADADDSHINVDPGGQATGLGSIPATVPVQTVIPNTQAQPTNYNLPPNDAQWPLTYGVTPLPQTSNNVQPTPLVSPTIQAEITVPSVPSTESNVGASLGQASFRIGTTASYVAATTIDASSMSADASTPSSFPTMTDTDVTTTALQSALSIAALPSLSPVSNAATQTATILLSTESFNTLLSLTPLTLASTVGTPTPSIIPVSTEPISSPIAISSFASLLPATSSVLSESLAITSLESTFRSSVLSFPTVSLSESTGSSFQFSTTTPFVSSTSPATTESSISSVESVSTTPSTTPLTTRTRTRTRTSPISTTTTTSASHSSASSTQSSSSFSSSSSTHSALTPAQTTDVPTPTSNGSTGHGTLFYLGVVFGVIVFIAFLAALIAWAIRVRSRALRRRDEWEASAIPWVKGDTDRADDMNHLEAGRNDGLNGSRNAPHGGGGGAAAGNGSGSGVAGAGAAGIGTFQSPWSPRHGSNYPQPGGEIKTFDGAIYRPGNSPGHMRKLPSHLVDKELAMRAQMDATNFVAVSRFPGSPAPLPHGYAVDPMTGMGPPHDAHTMPHFFPEPDRRPSISTRIRNLNKPAREDSLENMPPLPTPGAHLTGSQTQNQNQNWATSWKTGISNAFSAVSSRFSLANSSATVVDGRTRAEEAADRFTRAPSKRALRKSFRDDHYGSSEKLTLARGGSRSTTASRPWTLEEREDGTGAVHLKVPEDGHDVDEKHAHSSSSLRPSMNSNSHSNLSFGDGNSFGNAEDFSSDEAYAVNPTESTPTSLVATNKPQRAHVNTHFTRRVPKGASDESEYFSVISRETTESSIYSPQPTAYSDPRAIPTKLALVPSQGVPYIPSARDQDAHNVPIPAREDDSVVLQPDQESALDREPSVNASMMSSSTGDTRERERYEGVGDALKIRRKGMFGVGRS